MACTPPTITVGGVTLSTSDFENAKELLNTVSGDGGDPTLDGYEENIATGNNTAGSRGIQIPSSLNGTIPQQTSLPPPISQQSTDSNLTSGKGGNGIPVACTPWSMSYDEQLSPNFKVRDFTIGAVFPNELNDYPGYTKDERFCNIKNLAVNIAEPLLAKFGYLTINSGIRNKTSTPSGVSQHITGQAFDVQFAGWTYAKYWENAVWVKDNLPYDQFIFEHSDKTGLAWFHLSYNKLGNRPNGTASKVLTMYRNRYDPGLKRFG
jgi:hypothetical protein